MEKRKSKKYLKPLQDPDQPVGKEETKKPGEEKK